MGTKEECSELCGPLDPLKSSPVGVSGPWVTYTLFHRKFPLRENSSGGKSWNHLWRHTTMSGSFVRAWSIKVPIMIICSFSSVLFLEWLECFTFNKIFLKMTLGSFAAY